MDVPTWEKYYAMIRCAPLAQSYDYARATYSHKGRRARWGLIYIANEAAGIVQLSEASTLFSLFHAIILDMGPLWFDNNNLDKKHHAFFTELNRQFPKRIGRKRRIIPHIADETLLHKAFHQLAYKSHPSSYETLWINLEKDEHDLRSHLKQKWRNQLNKSEKQGLTFKLDKTGESFDHFHNAYLSDYFERNYKNIHPKQLPVFFKTFQQNRKVLLCHSLKDNKIAASALILLHGAAATYQIGIVTDLGRESCANHFLLWNAILHLKKIGIKDFDLGGINAYDAKGIQHFKEGLNGEKTTFKGFYS